MPPTLLEKSLHFGPFPSVSIKTWVSLKETRLYIDLPDQSEVFIRYQIKDTNDGQVVALCKLYIPKRRSNKLVQKRDHSGGIIQEITLKCLPQLIRHKVGTLPTRLTFSRHDITRITCQWKTLPPTT